ncbi:MAG: TldD/PmbA family protein [Pseudomonadota bacterium]
MLDDPKMKTDTDLSAQLLEIAARAGADAADVVIVTDRSVSIGVAEGALEEAESAEGREAGLRVLIGQRQACVSSSRLGSDALEAMAERAVAMAREAPDDPHCGLADPALLTAPPDGAALDMVDAEPAPDAAMLEDWALSAEAAALGVKGVGQVEQAHAQTTRVDITLAASNGFAGHYSRTTTGIGASAIAGEGLGRERDYKSEARLHRADLPSPAAIGQTAGERAVARLGPRKPPGGAVPVLFDERVASGLVSHVLVAVNGSSVARGSSWLRDAMDAQVLPAGLSITEDPLKVRGMNSRPFDAEGIAARPQPIVEDGRLVRWVLDSATARKLGLTTTGNARRGTTNPPSPGTSNIALTQGRESRADLIAAMGTGLLVTSLIGASINPTTGAYSRGASGFWVEGGEIAYPVNEITIAGMLPEMMLSLRPANDADLFRSISVPSCLVEGLTVGA